MPVLVSRAIRGKRTVCPSEVIPSKRPATGAPKRILLADPCRDTVESTAWLLRLWGYDVQGAGTGPETLEVALAYRPEVVLMELGLPGLDGCQVARRLRQQGTHPELLLVAVTGYGDEKNRRRSREAGFDCHLVKPVDPEVLQGLLATSRRDAGGR
jgi:two-component system, chemotaxis family, CheB/CheR fusion protein